MTIFVQYPWISITIGTLLVASGGLLATWGWNQNSELKNKENLITTVVHEWQVNDRMIKVSLSLANKWNVRAKDENFSDQPYKSTRLNALISSGAFGTSDKTFVDAAQDYENAIGEMEAALRIVGRFNTGVFINTDLIHNPPEEMPEDEAVLLSKPFRTVLDSHRRFGEVLSDKFPKLFNSNIL